MLVVVGVDDVNGDPEADHASRQRLDRRVVRHIHPGQRLAIVLATARNTTETHRHHVNSATPPARVAKSTTSFGWG